jgi:hypothetical protein
MKYRKLLPIDDPCDDECMARLFWATVTAGLSYKF